MIQTFSSYLAGSVGLALILKVSFILTLGSIVATLLRRRSAAARHVVWLTALVGALALAVLTPFAPRLPIDIPATKALAASPLDDVPGAGGSQAPALSSGALPPGEDAMRAARIDRPKAAVPAWRPMSMLGALWLAGFLSVLSWSAFGHLGLWALGRKATSIDRDTWERRFGASPASAARRVRLGLSEAVGTPLTWGWLRPIILLPRSAEAWPLERRRAALLHELAHVARCDYLAQTVAMLACAVYWFHPLVWWSAGRLRSESEHACDDCVLTAGTPAPDYASDLLEVAHGARGLWRADRVAVAMARPSHLEGRLLAVLDETRARGGIRTRVIIATMALATLCLVPFAGLEARLIAAADADAAPAAESERFPAKPGGELDLDLETGGDVEIRGWNRAEVSVNTQLRGSDADRSRATVTRTAKGVRVHSFQAGRRRSFSTSHRFQIRVPSRYDVRLNSAGGKVRVVDVDGSFGGHTGGGDIVITRARGDADLSTGGGDIDVSDSDLDGSVSTGGGMVKLSRVRGGLHGSSGSGPVIHSGDRNGSKDEDEMGDLSGVRVDRKGNRVDVTELLGVGVLNISKAGGDVNLTEAPRGARITTGGGDIHVGSGSGKVAARTGGGDIDIGPIAGSVSAGTGAGDIHVIIVDAGGKKQNVEITSGSGEVIVDLPEGLDARIELETSFTEGARQHTKITSAWSLDRDAVTPWDDHEGTSRRYVRAHGVVGRGDGLVHIKTVNGDIELRRRGRTIGR